MNADRTIEAGGKTYTIRFGQYAIFLIEQASGKGIETFEAVPRFSVLYLMLYAGLECARQKYRSRPQPWTMPEVGELIDAAGGIEGMQATIMDAWFAAFPEAKARVEAAMKEAGQEKNVEEPAAPPTGTTGSETHSSSV